MQVAGSRQAPSLRHLQPRETMIPADRNRKNRQNPTAETWPKHENC